MKLLNERRLARGAMLVLAAVFLSVSFAAYRHPVSSGVAKYITLDHELRHVFSRAERDSFKSAMKTVDATAGDAVPPQPTAEIVPSVEFIVTDYEIASTERSPRRFNNLIVNLSQVLNL